MFVVAGCSYKPRWLKAGPSLMCQPYEVRKLHREEDTAFDGVRH